MINKINRAMEQICFVFLNNVIDGESQILMKGEDEMDKLQQVEYSKRVLKKIIYNK